MTKRDYLKAVRIVQQDRAENGDIFTKLMVESFVQLFQGDNKRFDAKRFREACKEDNG